MPRTGRRSRSSTPRPGASIATAPLGGKADVDRAVEAARKAFDDPKGWASWPAGKRGRSLAKLSELVKKNTRGAGPARDRNTGKPITSARGEIAGVWLVFDYYAGAANKIFGQTIPVSKPGARHHAQGADRRVRADRPLELPDVHGQLEGRAGARRREHGHPQAGELLADDRAADGRARAGGGHPARRPERGDRPGGSAGAAIAAHPGIGKVAFTGETTTGQEIMRLASNNVKKISLELGGKSANVVYADADLERFAEESPYAVFDNCGQDCCARSRILVERSAHEQVVELFAEATKQVKVGDPADDATEVGTLVSFKQRDRVKDYIEVGLGEGAKLVVGGTEPDDPALATGAYLMPAVFDGVSNDMRIAREEIFGPVVSIIPFDSEAEAIQLANATPYGLSGSVWSRDIGKALRTARAIQSGNLSVNSNSSVHIEAPFGGYKMSGIGRELGMAAIELYTETKNIFIDLR